MLAIMLTGAQSASHLRLDWDAWITRYKEKPTAILGPRDLVYALVNCPEIEYREEKADTYYCKVPVLTLAEFKEIHSDILR